MLLTQVLSSGPCHTSTCRVSGHLSSSPPEGFCLVFYPECQPRPYTWSTDSGKMRSDPRVGRGGCRRVM